jgi:thiamine-monophosphate kinase
MNEFELIEHIRSRIAARGDRVVVGSGDDAAVVRTAGASVTSIDSFVEGVHFRLVTTSLGDLGHKCMAASLSDLAAMGAEPGEAYIAVGLPAHLGEREMLELVDGAESLAAEYATTICGGDLTRSDELFVVVTVVGYVSDPAQVVTRAGARAGDLVGVTGALGGAGAGLLLLDHKLGGLDVALGERLLERHLRPRPLIAAGRALARAGVHAMIDVSDGIASDLLRICEQSAVAAEVRLADLPVDEGVAEVAAAAGIDPADLAAAAGEDYELLFAASAGTRTDVEQAAEATGTTVTWIGIVVEPGTDATADGPVRLLDESGHPRRLRGWDHFPGAARGRPPGAPA